jgi:hypothetical protein
VNDVEHQCVLVRWEGDKSHYRRLVPNVVAKTFVATHVKTPTAAKLTKEMAIVHSLAEASVQPAGSLAQVSAASGTEGAAAAIGVAFAPTASKRDRPMDEPDLLMALPEAERTSAIAGYLAAKSKERRLDLVYKTNSLLCDFGVMDETTKEWLGRVVKNTATLLLSGPSSSVASTTSVADVALPRTMPDNALPWTVVSRAAYLDPKFKCKTPADESRLGRKVSDAIKTTYGARPAELNQGKFPQADATGVARATNVLTEVQCREVADDVIRAWFAK